ncbi:MAG: major capsid protein [Pseudomonadota bacterium]
MNPFDSDIFTSANLTNAINDVEHQPRRLGELGLFEEEGITTTSVVVERQGQKLALVGAKDRGAPGTPIGGDKRTGVTIRAVHLPTTATIMADEVQNVREFGSETGLQGPQQVVNTRLAKMARWLETTHEYQRIGAIKGQVIDSDGATVLIDYWNAFDMQQLSVDMALGTASTKVTGKCLQVLEEVEKGLGGLVFTGVRALCGRQFWHDLITHDHVEEAYKYQLSQRLRGDGREELDFGGIIWERYRGSVNSTAFVDDDEAYAVPMGVDDMFVTNFAPADYMTAVNTIGLPLYASSKMLDHDKGIELEAQTNPIHFNKFPKGVVKLERVAS